MKRLPNTDMGYVYFDETQIVSIDKLIGQCSEITFRNGHKIKVLNSDKFMEFIKKVEVDCDS